jgi:hypothetical protein
MRFLPCLCKTKNIIAQKDNEIKRLFFMVENKKTPATTGVSY